MTNQKNDHENTSETPSRPEGQDTSEAMDHKSPQDPDITEVLPAQATPPTQEIAREVAEQLPEDSAPKTTTHEYPAAAAPAPEGEVHPAYGVAAARAEADAKAEADAAAVQDAPVPDDTDPLAPLRDPAPQVSALPGATPPVSGAGAHPARPTETVVHQPHPQQPGQPAAEVATRRGPRVGTAVWGLIVIAVGLGILAVSAGVMFDLGVALIVLLGAAGVILVVGSVVSSLRRR